ncbi:hypothetical protein SUGI_0639180 [Cryptomeria japonica]|nr:hypothetical protein SUGI_0639180 [Cryptomeria japonica]
MPQTYLFLKSYAAKVVSQDIEAQVQEWSDLKAKEVQRKEEEEEESGNGVIMEAMVVVCLSFLSIFRVPIGLQRELGLEVAREAMESVGFKIFLVMDSLSFFLSLVVVVVVLQAMAFDSISYAHMKRVVRFCGTLAHLAMGSAAIAFVSAAAMFTRCF